MPDTNTSLRYTTDGLDTARQQLKQFGDDGQAAFDQVGDAADAASEKLDKASDSIAAVSDSGGNLSSFAATLSPLQQQLDAFGAGLDKINEGFSTSIDSSASLATALGDVTSGIAGATSAELGFLTALATGYASVANSNFAKTLTADILDLQRATGDSYASYAATADAIKALGGDSEGVNSAIDHIKDAILGIGDAAPTARAAIEAMGVSLDGLSASDAPQVLQDIIDKSDDYADSRQKTALIEAATGQSSVKWLKEIADAQDFTNEQTRQSETVLGEMAQSAIDADARIKQVNSDPGLFGSILGFFKDATTESEQWAEDSGRSTQEVQQGWTLLWAGFANTNWSAVTDGWDQLSKGAHNYALTLENEVIPDWGKYIGLVAEAPDFGNVSTPKAAAPDPSAGVSTATQSAVDAYTASLQSENEALLLTSDQQDHLNDLTKVYNDVMGLFKDQSPAWIQAHMSLVTALLDEGNAQAQLKRSTDELAATQKQFKTDMDAAAKSVQAGLDQIQAWDDAAKAADDQRQQTVQGLADEANTSAVLLAAYKDGQQAYSDAEESEQILAAVRALGAGATQKEKDAVANYTAAVIENNAALASAKQVSDSQQNYTADINALTQKNALLQQELTMGGELKGQQDAYLTGQQAEIQYEKQNPGLLQSEYDAYGQLITQQQTLKNAITEQNKATQEIMNTISNGVKNLFENTFENVFEHGLKGFADFGNQVIQLFAQVAAKIAEELIINAALSLTVSGSGGGGAAGTVSSGISAISTGSSLLSGGSTIGSYLSGSAGSGLGAAQGAGAAEGSSLVGGSSGALTGTLGAVGGAAALGYGTSEVVGSVTGSHVAGDILGGAAAGMLIGGPIGAVAGAVIGGVIAAFSKPPQNNDGLAFIGSNHGNGTIHIAGVTSDHQDISGAQTIAAQEVTDVNAFAKAYGLKVNAPGSQDLGIAIGPNANPNYPQTEQASIAKLLQNHDFSSGNPAIEKLLKSSGATDLNTLASQIGAITQGAAALSATLSLTGHAVTETQTQMAALGMQFEADKASAVTYGYTVAAVEKGYRDTFNTSVNDALVAVYNPEKLALASAQADASARYQTAKELGANLLNVEKVNQQDRLAIYEQYDGVTLAQLRASLTATGHASDDVESSMAATIQTFEQATKAANDFNSLGTLKNVPTAAQVQTTYAGQFNTSISDQYLQLVDPEKYALEQESRDAAARLAAAKKVGGDINEVEKLNAAERLAIVQQYAADAKTAAQQAAQQQTDSANQLLTTAGGTLSDYIKSLQYGSNSALTPAQQFSLSQSQYETESRLAANGNVAAIGDLGSYADAYLTQARTEFGTTAAYTKIFQQVVADLNTAGGALGGDAALKNAQMMAKATADGSKAIVVTLKTELALVRQELATLNKQVKSSGLTPKRMVA